MTVIQILASGSIVLITHLVQTVTGFGSTVLALPFLSQIISLKAAIPTLAILSWILSLYIVCLHWRRIVFRQYLIILAFVSIGLPFGIIIFRIFQASFLQKALAIFIIIISIKNLIEVKIIKFKNSHRTKILINNFSVVKRWSLYALLILGGVIHGAFASGGPLIVLYTASAIKDFGSFRSTLSLLWITFNTILILNYFISSSFTVQNFRDTAILIPFLFLGIWIGDAAHNYFSKFNVKPIISAVLGMTGIIMLVS
ncbi:hypothetical protein B4O97_07810 [Marispirochaeta aestuarii]|uniref:Probable membrane transporter protein n=1 Tax=Marispirochaeta aestuarii TaxID=1963862 RepID=A0A1Y1S0F4_9SPIO|nr:sulfite exporter TauE/SafE family protein [Marispirochaeta aestuarii]ORC35965.1 hypothetical protein B4O97_07810 [Marispirochaeta aestuarii]